MPFHCGPSIIGSKREECATIPNLSPLKVSHLCSELYLSLFLPNLSSLPDLYNLSPNAFREICICDFILVLNINQALIILSKCCHSNLLHFGTKKSVELWDPLKGWRGEIRMYPCLCENSNTVLLTTRKIISVHRKSSWNLMFSQ